MEVSVSTNKYGRYNRLHLLTSHHGVVGIIRPLLNVSGPSSVKSSGYCPITLPPFTAPPIGNVIYKSHY